MNIFEKLDSLTKRNKQVIKKEERICQNGYRIAGVTFDNEDGTSRQKIIKSLNNGDTVNLKIYDYEGRTAIGVYTCDGKQIGNIKESDVPYALNRMNTMVKSEINNIDFFFSKEQSKYIYTAFVVIYFK